MRRGWVFGSEWGQRGVLNAGAPGDAHITVTRALWPRARIGSGAKWQKNK